jgi:hypothetical protein
MDSDMVAIVAAVMRAAGVTKVVIADNDLIGPPPGELTVIPNPADFTRTIIYRPILPVLDADEAPDPPPRELPR